MALFDCIMLIFTPFYHITKKSSPQLVSSCGDDLVLQRGFEPRDRGDAAITFYPLRSKTLRVWCPGFERAKPRKEKTDRTRRSVFSFGAPAGIRTPDTLLKRQVLCLLSYWGAGARTSRGAALTYWLGWRDSNPLYRSQSPVCYHYTTSQWLYERGLTACGRGPLSGGVGYGARTHDTRNHNPVLCQLS